MTEIMFHFNVADRLDYTCRLLRKAAASDLRIHVVGSAAQLESLDSRLWSFEATSFVAHCGLGAQPSVIDASPVILGYSPDGVQAEVLLNLDAEVPQGFGTFERLIEVVSLDEHDRHAARQRWKHYADRGYAIRRHEAAPNAGTSA